MYILVIILDVVDTLLLILSQVSRRSDYMTCFQFEDSTGESEVAYVDETILYCDLRLPASSPP